MRHAAVWFTRNATQDVKVNRQPYVQQASAQAMTLYTKAESYMLEMPLIRTAWFEMPLFRYGPDGPLSFVVIPL